jgi:hypothetical protein
MWRCQAAVFTSGHRPSVTATARAGAFTCSASKGNFGAKTVSKQNDQRLSRRSHMGLMFGKIGSKRELECKTQSIMIQVNQ